MATFYRIEQSRKKIYDIFSESYHEDDELSFKDEMKNPKYRRAVYDLISEKWDIGSYDTFETKLGYKRPGATTESQDYVLLAEKAIELNPNSKRASFILMWYYWENNKYDESIAWAKKHLNVHPESATSYYMLCACYLAKNMEVEARKFYALGCKIDPINEVRSHLENKYYEIKYNW